MMKNFMAHFSKLSGGLDVLLCELRVALRVVGEDAEGVGGAQTQISHCEGGDVLRIDVRVLRGGETQVKVVRVC
ncbi:hypothetical protein E2C01_065733 [Portunus trituberculatus]|uniref:Uncharacterized protein n=1 Tax=Portunus trituberculatus TaxID=210409 RepID=A0A5B7HND1_PORTR|nr:hypothetical protein [Portunus trituberculatus]